MARNQSRRRQEQAHTLWHKLAARMSNEKPNDKILVFQLVALLLVLAIIPLFERYIAGRVALTTGLTVVFVTGIIVNRRHPAVLLSGVVILVLGIPMAWATLFVDHLSLFVGSCVLQGVFFSMTAVVIMWGVFRWHAATVHSVYGAVSAYLLLGLAWAMFYWGLDLFDATAFEIPHRRTLVDTVGGRELTSFSQMVYFSFVCMSSLGFGDISPRTGVAETLCWLQSVVGQFYMAILVARLVGAIPVVRQHLESRSK
jgi:voltage-gated potassium channel